MRDNARKRTQLGRRLEAALDMLGHCDTVWDVGCDHGYLAAALIEQGRAERVLASDLSPVSVAKTFRLAEERGISQRLDVSQGDGLTCFDPKGEYNLALCGMGGELIADILSACYEKASAARLIVMQPMRGEEELRRWLCENGFAIINERAVLDDGRYYQLIAAARGEMTPPSEWFPKGYYRIGWVMCEAPDEALIGLIKKHRSSHEKRLRNAAKKGAAPERLVYELECIDAIIAHLNDTGAWH